MKKRKLHMWTSNNKRVKVSLQRTVHYLLACLLSQKHALLSYGKTLGFMNSLWYQGLSLLKMDLFCMSRLKVTWWASLNHCLKTRHYLTSKLRTWTPLRLNKIWKWITLYLRKVTEMWPLLMEWQKCRVLISYYGFKHANSLPTTL